MKRMLRHSLPLLLLASSFTAWAQRAPYADSLLLDAQYEQVIQWADQYVEAVKGDTTQLIMTMSRKAEAWLRLGNYEEAERLLMSLPPAPRDANVRSTLEIAFGSLFLNQGLYEKADTRFEAALQALELAGQSDSFEASKALSYLGNLRRATGEHTQAEELLTRSLRIRERMFGSTSEWIAASYNDLGLVFSQTDSEKALEFYERALAIYQSLHKSSHPKIAIALTNIGFAYSAIELYGDAISNFEAALRIWESIYPQAHPTKAFLNLSLGEIYRKLKNLPAATAYYDKSLVLYQHSYNGKHPDLAAAYNALGNVRLEQGDHDAALQAYHRALASNLHTYEESDDHRLPAVRGYYNGRTLLNSMLFVAQALESRYFARTIKLKDLVRAHEALLACDTLADQLRQRIGNEADKIALGALVAQVYQSGVRICVAAADVAFNKKPWLERAFYFAEKGKSAVLLEGISDVHAKAFARIPAPLLDEERQLRAAMALATTELAQKPSPSDEPRIRERLFAVNRQYEQFVSRLERDFPQYYNLKYNTAAPGVRKIQQELDDATAIVSYLIDDTHGGLYVFVITRKHYKVYQRALPPDLDRNITGLRNGLVFNAAEPYRRASAALSAVLLPKIPVGIRSLVIIPTGRLSVVPFETLLAGKQREGKSFRYLIQDYDIRYEFTASLILQKSEQTASKKAILLCAPVDFSAYGLSDLPGTATEVNAIDALFSKYQFDRTVLLDTGAEEATLRNQSLNAYQYLHFATHGVVDENHPELSRLYLKEGGRDDGLLYSGEIYNLDLNAELVTLSACQTGLGKISKGEGVIGLSRALAYAGARRMVVSFWRVADESTSLLMQEFYRTLLVDLGRNPGQHLKSAKLALIKSGKYASPYYWAPFVLIGF